MGKAGRELEIELSWLSLEKAAEEGLELENRGDKICAEMQKGFSVSSSGCVLIQLKTNVHSVGSETGGRHVYVVHVGVFVGLGMYMCAGVACGMRVQG